jgi:hypothetical protein
MTEVKLVEDPTEQEHKPAFVEVQKEQIHHHYYEAPSWVRAVQSFTQGVGLCIGVVLALPFIAISRGIEWYQDNKKNKVEEEV